MDESHSNIFNTVAKLKVVKYRMWKLYDAHALFKLLFNHPVLKTGNFPDTPDHSDPS